MRLCSVHLPHQVRDKLMLKRREIRFGPSHVNDYDTKVAIPEFLKTGIKQKKFANYIVDATKTQKQVIQHVQKIILKNWSF